MNIVAFGIGVNFYSYIERLDSVMDVHYFSDNDERKWNQYIMGDKRVCIPPSEIKKLERPLVIILAEKANSKSAIEKQLAEMKIEYIEIDAIWDEVILDDIEVNWPQKIQKTRIHKFIELLVHGTTECNFHCDYCYVWRKEDFHQGLEASLHTPKEIREALSVNRLGGVCHINMCALGETLFAHNIEKIIYELADEGHYVSVITNGTVSAKINQILEFPEEIQEKIFFKLSFHLLELERTKLLSRFWRNVETIRKSKCSYSIEITPSDLIIGRLDVIKREFESHAGGAMPHITFTRDATKEGLDLYSDLSLEEYKEIWGRFQSELFTLKSDLYKRKITENCYAGCWSYRINLMNGNLQSCYQQEIKGNIFERLDNNLPIRTVKNQCALNYCFNNHAFIAWGDVPEIECKNYLAMRERYSDGETWIKQPYRAIMSQKLYNNNFLYIGRWKDYEKLYSQDREPAFILFNSPDYGNMGDHAIAYTERKFFNRIFPQKEFIEISSEQYLKENMSIVKAVLPEDILLISGGGYIGSIWTWLEDLTLNIIKRFPQNKIIILPQTIYFEESMYGNYEKKLFINALENHTNITVVVRDNRSLQMVKEWNLESEQILYCPDMALSLSLDNYRKKDKKNEIKICLRDDKEKGTVDIDILETSIQQSSYNITFFTTTVGYDVNLNNREKELRRLWKDISSAQIVITDRLHAVIFCYLLDVPCIALNNKTGKVFDFVNSVRGSMIIYKCESVDEVRNAIRDIEHGELKGNTNNFKRDFLEFENYLKGKCFI